MCPVLMYVVVPRSALQKAWANNGSTVWDVTNATEFGVFSSVRAPAVQRLHGLPACQLTRAGEAMQQGAHTYTPPAEPQAAPMVASDQCQRRLSS